MALDNDEFKFPDELGEEIKIDIEDDEISIEIEDDTPKEDRNRAPLPKEMVDELEKDELDNYSDRVKDRMAKLKKVWHDERRAKESASREREEAVRFAQTMIEENKRLKHTLTNGEQEYLEVSKRSAQGDLDAAKREYRDAYDSGDTDKVIEAQQKLTEAQFKVSQVQNYKLQHQSTLQERETSVNIQPEQTQSPKPDKKALAWQDKNDWFGSDEEMTSLALGLHEKLVKSGVEPSSDEYYKTIDKTMQKRFPEYFEDDTLDEDVPAQRTKPSTVVASATRSTAPKKVRLTASQLALAKKFGLTPEQYAKETLKLEKR